MSSQNVRSFTTSYDRVVSVLTTKVRIQEAFDLQGKKPEVPEKEYIAIWDTGATKTAITEKVVRESGLKPTGMCKVGTAGGERDANTYYVSLYLPNMVCIPQLRVSEVNVAGADVLIGMDIIASGDFAVTHQGGKSCMSFRMPSVECIDFVKQKPPTVTVDGKVLRKVGRNELCPCGSGKKYKHCCGR